MIPMGSHTGTIYTSRNSLYCRYHIMYLFFDLETTGLPKKPNGFISDLDNWPRIVQIAWSCHDTFGTLMCTEDYLICPDGFTIPRESTAIHGITDEQAQKNGVPAKEALFAFLKAAKSCRYLVAHNIAFDFPVICAEFLRYNIPHDLYCADQICTMKTKAVIHYCQAKNSQGGLKWPKLSELYQVLFNEPLCSAHDARADVQACARCFFELKARGVFDE